MRGHPLVQYFHNPTTDESYDKIYKNLDGFTYELFEEESEYFNRGLLNWVFLPPLHYEGKLVKGIFISSGPDLLLTRLPEITQLFHVVAASRCHSIPWSTSADMLTSTYDNPHRVEWFYKTYPHRRHQIIAPFEHETDNLNEYIVAPPSLEIERDIDVLCVSRLFEQKNIPIVIQAAIEYVKKYNPEKFKLVHVVGTLIDDALVDSEKEVYRQLQAQISELPSNLTIETIPYLHYGLEMSTCYRRAKVFTVASLLEGKCRSVREAMYCDTPVVMFQAFNQYARGREALFPDGAGLAAPEFTAMSLADTWHQVFQECGTFKPRKRALECYGRKKYFNKLLSYFSYYQTAVPEWDKKNAYSNVWLNLAIHANYQVSLYDFIYGRCPDLSDAFGLDLALILLEKYLDQFGVPICSKKTQVFSKKQFQGKF